jgi:hypothetical protein
MNTGVQSSGSSARRTASSSDAATGTGGKPIHFTRTVLSQPRGGPPRPHDARMRSICGVGVSSASSSQSASHSPPAAPSRRRSVTGSTTCTSSTLSGAAPPGGPAARGASAAGADEKASTFTVSVATVSEPTGITLRCAASTRWEPKKAGGGRGGLRGKRRRTRRRALTRGRGGGHAVRPRARRKAAR